MKHIRNWIIQRHFLIVPAAKRGTSLGLPSVFFLFFYLCRGLQPLDVILDMLDSGYLTIRPRGRMDYESIAHEAYGLMGYSNS